jgi:hypothetical protein
MILRTDLACFFLVRATIAIIATACRQTLRPRSQTGE